MGMHLRQMRRLQKLTQSEVARRAGITPGALSKLESGETHAPALSTLQSLSEVLRLPMETLLALASRGDMLVCEAREAAAAFARANGIPQWAIDAVPAREGVTSPEAYYLEMKRVSRTPTP